MKNYLIPLLAIGLASLTPTLAQESEEDNIQAILSSIFVAEPGSVGLSEVLGESPSLLGASFSELPEVVAKQLKLKFGLTVQYIEPNSASSKAGLKPMDILLKIDDQLIFNTEQLRKLINYHGEGKTVQLKYMREGDQHEVSCTFVKGTSPRVTDKGALQELIRLVISDGKLMDRALEIDSGLTTVTSVNGETMLVTKKNGKQNLRIKDRVGKIIFDGPIESEEERKTVPENHRKTLNKILGIIEK